MKLNIEKTLRYFLRNSIYFIPVIGFYLIDKRVRDNPNWKVGIVAIYNLIILLPLIVLYM